MAMEAADYKSAALPAKLYQHLSNEQIVYYQTSIRLSTGEFEKRRNFVVRTWEKRHHDSVHAVCSLSLCAQGHLRGRNAVVPKRRDRLRGLLSALCAQPLGH